MNPGSVGGPHPPWRKMRPEVGTALACLPVIAVTSLSGSLILPAIGFPAWLAFSPDPHQPPARGSGFFVPQLGT